MQQAILSRRDFLSTGMLAAFSAATIGCRPSETSPEPKIPEVIDPKISDAKALADFLNRNQTAGVSRQTLNKEPILYHISKTIDGRTRTSGCAIRITENLFLTAYHVVDEDTPILSLVPQMGSEKLATKTTDFEVVASDPENDIALLRATSAYTSEVQSQQAFCSLTAVIPNESDRVVKFSRLSSHRLSKTDYSHTVHAKDLYSETSEEGLFTISLPSGTLLLEEEGKILPYRFDELQKKYAKDVDLLPSAEHTRLCTIFAYNGESGLPVFYKREDGSFDVCGIITKAMGLAESVKVSGHPLGYTEMQLTTSCFTHRTAVEALILEFLNNGN